MALSLQRDLPVHQCCKCKAVYLGVQAHLSVLKGITGRGSLRIGSAAVMLSSDTSAGDLPIFDASIMDTSADATLEDGQLNGALNAQICGNVYSSQKDGWEPVIEPWCFAIDATALLHR